MMSKIESKYSLPDLEYAYAKGILAIYIIFYYSIGLRVTDEHFFGLIFAKHTHDWNPYGGKWQPSYTMPSPICYFMVVSFIIMNLVLFGLFLNHLYAPILLGLHIAVLTIIIVASITVGTIVENLGPGSVILNLGLVLLLVLVSLFFELVAIWLAYDLYRTRRKKMDLNRRVKIILMKGNEAPVEEEEDSQTISNGKVNAQNFALECV